MVDRRKIIEYYTEISGKIKDFLLSTKSREFFIFLLFFFIAGAFWLIQTLNEDYEAEFTIPVRMRNVPNNVVITSDPASDLKIKVKDKGTVLMNYWLGKNFFPVNLDFNDYKGINNHVRILASEYEKRIVSQLNSTTRLVSVVPDTLEYIYSTGGSKRVPVRFQGKVSSGREYYIADTIFNPDSITIYAPSSILDTIRNAYIQPVNYTNISDSTVYTVPLIGLRGAKFDPNSILLSFLVDIYTEKTVDVPIYGINFPADKILRTFPSKVQITFQIGMSRFKEITADNFAINVSYEELLMLGTDKYTPKLKTIPPEVSNIRISPPQIDFLIEQISSNVN